jgi:hypothetical protein
VCRRKKIKPVNMAPYTTTESGIKNRLFMKTLEYISVTSEKISEVCNWYLTENEVLITCGSGILIYYIPFIDQEPCMQYHNTKVPLVWFQNLTQMYIYLNCTLKKWNSGLLKITYYIRNSSASRHGPL